MASLADASMASLPRGDIEALQAQLLAAHNPSSDPHAMQSVTHNNDPPADNSYDSEVPESQNIDARSSPDTTTRGHAQSVTQRASTNTKAMDSDSISQPRLLATTFHGGLGGDTQVNDTQVYRHFQEQAHAEAFTTPYKPLRVVQNTTGGKSLDEDTYTNLGSANAGDDGSFLELNLSPGGKSDVSDMISVLASPQTQSQMAASRVGTFPETPQLAGCKRGSDGQIVPSATKDVVTPGYDALFGPAKTPLLTTTQLFQRTQAVSSPLPDGPRSDPVITRPSPNLQDNSVYTSHLGFSSSPNLARHNAPSSTAFEPREKYTSMLESQNRRTQSHFNGLPQVQEEDDPFDNSDTRRLNSTMARRIWSDQALAECRSVSAPARTSSSTRQIDQQTTVTAQQQINTNRFQRQTHSALGAADEDTIEPIDISDDDDNEDDSNMSDNGSVHHGDTNDAYDEFAQAVVRSSAIVQPDDEIDRTVSGDVHEDDLDNQGDRPLPREASTGSGRDAEVVPGSQVLHDAGRVFHPTQSTSLIGSQMVPQSEKRSLLSTTHQQPSSITSVIPGSQYPQVTSDRLAKQSQTRSQQQHAVHDTPVVMEQVSRVASSPPLPELLDHEDQHFEEHIVPDLHTPSKAMIEPHERAQHSDQLSEVLDSELVPVAPTVDSNATADTLKGSTAEESGRAYATAPTQPPTHKPHPSGHAEGVSGSQYSMATPLKRAGARRAMDIANMPTQRTIDEDPSADIDDAAGVLNELDAYAHPVSPSAGTKRNGSPASAHTTRKRRRIERTVMSSNSRPSSTQAADPSQAPELSNGSELLQDRDHVIDQSEVHVVDAEQLDEAGDVSKTLTVPSLSAGESDEVAVDTPKSVRVREAAGSAAVSQLIAARLNDDLQPAKLSGPGKRTYSRKGRARQAEHVKEMQRIEHGNASENEAENPTRDETGSVSVAEAAPRPLDGHLDHDSSTPTIVRSDRVFALFQDARSFYYPATVVGRPASSGLIQVRFDDGSTSEVKPTQLAPLDIRIGDVFKVDEPSMRNNWIVTSFTQEVEGSHVDKVDIYGHSAMLVLPNGAKRTGLLPEQGQQEMEAAVTIGVTSIYLTKSMLPTYKKRESSQSYIKPHPIGEPSTPVRASTSTTVNTPKSRSGRQAARKHQYMLPSSSAQTDELVRAPKTQKMGDIFNNMAFAVTSASSNAENETARLDWIDDIQANGGTILNDFDELFEAMDHLHRRPSSNEEQHKDTLALEVKSPYQTLGFVALISDKHCRKTKYIQALALGIPTLSSRWIVDSISQSRAAASGTGRLLPWSEYLLPAGESAYLYGAVRSRTLTPYHPSQASLPETIDARQRLLHGERVLVVMPQKDRSSLAGKRQSYAFLTLAIGAGDVRAVEDINEAIRAVEQDPSWTYVMVDKNVPEATESFDGNRARGSKKRKSVADAEVVLSSTSRGGELTIVSHEWVLQSLMLGARVRS